MKIQRGNWQIDLYKINKIIYTRTVHRSFLCYDFMSYAPYGHLPIQILGEQ